MTFSLYIFKRELNISYKVLCLSIQPHILFQIKVELFLTWLVLPFFIDNPCSTGTRLLQKKRFHILFCFFLPKSRLYDSLEEKNKTVCEISFIVKLFDLF